jgi:hypothetical protein
MPRSNLIFLKFSTIRRAKALSNITFYYFFLVFLVATNGYVLAMVGHLKNVSPTFAQMPNRFTKVEFTTFSPTIANTMLWVCANFF